MPCPCGTARAAFRVELSLLKMDPRRRSDSTEKGATPANDAAAPVSAAPGTVTMQLYHRLREDIIRGALAPGQKLKIDELCRSYEVGSSPLREALNLLTSFGFVERLEQRGFQVKPISADEYDDIVRCRCWIEERALREAIAHGDGAWEEDVTLALFRLDRAARVRHAAIDPEWEKLHHAFHMTLLAPCGSSILMEYCEHLFTQSIRYRQIAGLLELSVRDPQAEHAEIAKAVLERDADAAVALLCAHYRRTQDALKAKLFAAG